MTFTAQDSLDCAANGRQLGQDHPPRPLHLEEVQKALRLGTHPEIFHAGGQAA